MLDELEVSNINAALNAGRRDLAKLWVARERGTLAENIASWAFEQQPAKAAALQAKHKIALERYGQAVMRLAEANYAFSLNANGDAALELSNAASAFRETLPPYLSAVSTVLRELGY